MPGVVTVFQSESAPYRSWGLSHPKANFNLFDSPLQGQKEPAQEAEVQRSKKEVIAERLGRALGWLLLS